MSFEPIMKEFNFSEAETEFVRSSSTATTAHMNESRNISELVLGKQIENAAQKIIKSNESLAESNDRHAAAMKNLTLALVIITGIQVIIQVVTALH